MADAHCVATRHHSSERMESPFWRCTMFGRLEGGPDTTDNVAACCPNCHRQLHHDPARNSLRNRLLATVKHLKDHPPRPC
ncbi:HNH endonuclease [Pacificitalea manganoxidans]|uniref:HNH endonuclease n=2 Tax=Pacificitalea manganoxidans TaxID=1411902 RepID=UPI0035B5338F